MAADPLSDGGIENILCESDDGDDFDDSDYEAEEMVNNLHSDSSASDPEEDNSDPDEPAPTRLRCANGPTPTRARAVRPGDWVWKSNSSGVDIPQKVAFSGIPGIQARVQRRLPDQPEVLDLLRSLIKDDFWDFVAEETNRYAKQFLDNPTTNKSNLTDSWFDTNRDELQAYFALCILMGQVKKQSLESYWSTRQCIVTPFFSEIMPYKRFLLLSRFLHFKDNTKIAPNSRLGKLEPVVDYLNRAFQTVYAPSENLGLDESLMKFRGRLCFVQYNPSKRARFGIKFYKLCESSSGYCVQLSIYLGKKPDGAGDGTPASEAIVMELMEPYLGLGHSLYLDNWYTSPSLFQQLLENNTNAVGTVRINRKQMPKCLKETQLRKGEAEVRFSHKMIAIKWMDKKPVHILSTFHNSIDMTATGKISRATNEPVIKPKAILDYNLYMNAVDRQDQQLASFPIMRRYAKGYKKIFFYIMDIAIYNSYALYKKETGKRKFLFDKYRIDLAEQILTSVRLPDYQRRGRPTVAASPARLLGSTWAHFPRPIAANAVKQYPLRVCVVCKEKKKRSESRWECERCLVALHLPECFKVYHTVKKF